jgi:chromosome segregation ATPase
MASPAYENMFKSFQDTFTGLRAEMTRLEIENKRLVEHNTVIEKELETLNEENVKLSGANNDAMKKLAEVEEKNAGLQKEYSGLEGLKEVLGWKKRCEELENRATENQGRMEKRCEELENRATENQERMEKMDKRIAEVQQQSQQNFEVLFA